MCQPTREDAREAERVHFSRHKVKVDCLIADVTDERSVSTTFAFGNMQVRIISNLTTRDKWGTAKDGTLLIEALTKDPTCVCTWQADCFHQLSTDMWSTAEQQLLAKQFGGVSIQDNTCLANR